MNGIGLLGFLYLFHSAFAKDAMADAIACLESNPGSRILTQAFFHALDIGETFCFVFVCQRRIIKKSVRIDIENESGRIAGRTIDPPSARLGEVEPFLSASQSNKSEPALFFHRLTGARLP